MISKIVAVVFFIILSISPVFAEELSVATTAGYMNMVKELCSEYKEVSGNKVQEMYGGNLGQQLAQIESGSGVNVIIADRGTLDAVKTNVKFGHYEPLGQTVLVLAWRRGLSLSSPDSLCRDEIMSVCYPDPKAAIYGRAAVNDLKSSGIGEKISDKLFQVSTVPQVFSYLVSKEMDAGFVNRVAVCTGSDKIGGYIEIESGYPPINMTAATVMGFHTDPEVKVFLDFLKTKKGRDIMKKYGVW